MKLQEFNFEEKLEEMQKIIIKYEMFKYELDEETRVKNFTKIEVLDKEVSKLITQLDDYSKMFVTFMLDLLEKEKNGTIVLDFYKKLPYQVDKFVIYKKIIEKFDIKFE